MQCETKFLVADHSRFANRFRSVYCKLPRIDRKDLWHNHASLMEIRKANFLGLGGYAAFTGPQAEG